MICPQCYADNSVQDSVDKPRIPKPGDFSFCSSCGACARFEQGPFGLNLRTLTEDELAAVKTHPSYQAFQATFVRGWTWQGNLRRWREFFKKGKS